MTNSVRIDKLHIAMLKRLNIQCEGGIPAVDGKRPYGNKDIIQDLVEIYNADLGYEIIKIENGGFLLLDGDRVMARVGQSEDDILNEDDTKEQDLELKLYSHHREMDTVLSILVQELSIQEGIYTKNDPWNPGAWVYEGIGQDGVEALAVSTDEKTQTPQGPRRVAVAAASSLPASDQDYVDRVLDRHIFPDDQVLLDSGNYNHRILDYIRRKDISYIIRAVRLNRVDQVLSIYDPSMDTENSASEGPRSLQLWAQDKGIKIIQEEAIPATGIRAIREVS